VGTGQDLVRKERRSSLRDLVGDRIRPMLVIYAFIGVLATGFICCGYPKPRAGRSSK